MKSFSAYSRTRPWIDFPAYVLRGVSQVVFINNPISGLFITAALFVANWYTAFYALVGVISATLISHYLQLPLDDVRAGLYGFNGCLVGLSIATFSINPFSDSFLYGSLVQAVLFSSMMSVIATILQISLAKCLTPLGGSCLTLPFNFSALMYLLATYTYSYTSPDSSILSPALPASRNGSSYSIRTSWGDVIPGDTPMYISFFEGWLRGVAQVYFADNVWSGLIMTLGIAISSPIAASEILLGSLTGLAVGSAAGASGLSLYHGLWGYNSALGAMSIGYFCERTVHTTIMKILCAATCALVFGASSTFFSPFGVPSLTFPFCLGTLPFLISRDKTSRLQARNPNDGITVSQGEAIARKSKLNDKVELSDLAHVEEGKAPERNGEDDTLEVIETDTAPGRRVSAW